MKKISLLFCVILGLQTHLVSALTLATWNMQWLSTHNDIEDSKRSAQDYQTLQDIGKRLNADLIAVQEVDSKEALEKVFPKTDYKYYLSDRINSIKNKASVQYTGWVVRKDLKVKDHKDIKSISVSNPGLRYGAYIEVDGIHLLSVHLKSGCFSKRDLSKKKKNCKILQKQSDELKEWIDEKNNLKQNFVILGDFNHNLSDKNDWFWEDLTSKLPKHSLVKLTKSTKGECTVYYDNGKKKRVYKNLIDHIIANRSLFSDSPIPQAKQLNYKESEAKKHNLSDHCPVSVTLAKR